MALYRFAVDNDEIRLRENYPLIFQAISHQRSVCLTDVAGSPITVRYTKKPNEPTVPPEGQFVINANFTRCLTNWAQGAGGSSTVSTTAGTDT
jgi:hypothetical protein